MKGASKLVSRAFGPVEREFLAMWLPKLPADTLAERFEAAFGRELDASKLKWFAERNRISRPKHVRKTEWLTPEREAWLREHYGTQRLKRTLAQFNERFGLSLSYATLSSANKRFRFGTIPKTLPYAFSPEEIEWLREHLPQAPHREVVDAFEERFGRRLSEGQVKNFVTRHGCQGAPNTGRFKPGHKPSPLSGAKRPNRTSFAKGHRRNPEAEIYEERERYKHGKLEGVFVKVPGPAPFASIRSKGWQSRAHWVPKARWLWERENGPVPDGQVVVHRDGDPANCELDNLVCVSRSVLTRMNAYHAPKRLDPATPEGRELNVARLRIAQLSERADEVANEQDG